MLIAQTAFKALLSQFNELVSSTPSVASIKSELAQIRDDAAINPELNLRQKEAIIARVDNYINGTYGKKDQEFKAHKQS